MKDRFTLIKVQGSDKMWQCLDRKKGILITFEEHQFNETQQIAFLGKDTPDALSIAKDLREAADWLRENHYDKAMPTPDSVDVRHRIGARISELRREKGMTQMQLAQAAGLQRVTVARIEAGRFAARLDTLEDIARALGGSVELIDK